MKLAHKLKHRIKILKGVQTPNDDGGFDQTYETLLEVWAGIEGVGEYLQNLAYVRGENISDQKTPTHKFIIRWVAVQNLGKQFNKAFSIGYKGTADLMPLKSDYFVFLKQGSDDKGRLFKILDISRDENFKEFFKFRAAEIEEKGTGWPE